VAVLLAVAITAAVVVAGVMGAMSHAFAKAVSVPVLMLLTQRG
jgi:hypothetical protein